MKLAQVTEDQSLIPAHFRKKKRTEKRNIKHWGIIIGRTTCIEHITLNVLLHLKHTTTS